MFKVEVTDRIEEKTIPAKGDRPAFPLFEQEAYAHLGGRYPERIVITHRNRADAYAAGEYQPDVTSFYVGKFAQLQMGLRLKPLKKAAAA